jgi:hypothetical protein
MMDPCEHSNELLNSIKEYFLTILVLISSQEGLCSIV